jgi:hypothetical protein
VRTAKPRRTQPISFVVRRFQFVVASLARRKCGLGFLELRVKNLKKKLIAATLAKVAI